MKTDDLLLAKFRWPEGEDRDEKAGRAMMSSAKNELKALAPVELPATGFQLLPKDNLSPLEESIHEDLAACIILLPVPPDELEGGHPLYHEAEQDARQLLVDELTELADKVPNLARVTKRFMTQAFVALDAATAICDADFDEIRGYMDKLANFPHGRQREKSERLFRQLAAKVAKG